MLIPRGGRGLGQRLGVKNPEPPAACRYGEIRAATATLENSTENAHLADHPLRAATDRFGSKIAAFQQEK
jgi:hypothetical protein